MALAYEEANAAILAEDWDTAEARLRSILAVDPVYADASERLDFVLHQREISTLFRAGVAAYDDGDFSQAIEHLERLSELDADLPTRRRARAALRALSARWPGAAGYSPMPAPTSSARPWPASARRWRCARATWRRPRSDNWPIASSDVRTALDRRELDPGRDGAG